MRKAEAGAGRKGLPMTLGEPAGPNDVHGKIVKLSTSEGHNVVAHFLVVVDHIVVANRQPSAWEAGCLYSALCALAIGNEMKARRLIGLALLPGDQQELPVSVLPLPTAEELRQALTLILTLTRARRLADEDPAAAAANAVSKPRARCRSPNSPVPVLR
jgi:hypothetical protein